MTHPDPARPDPARPDDVHVEALTPNHRLRARVLELRPSPDQENWSSRAAVTLPEAETDPGRTPFAIVATTAGRSEAVGFGVLDRAGYLADLVDDPDRSVLLRGYYVDAGAQGRGVGGRAARSVRLLAATLPDVELVVLTVNAENPGAAAAYRRGGFVDTGAQYLGGGHGPQHVYVATVLNLPTDRLNVL